MPCEGGRVISKLTIDFSLNFQILFVHVLPFSKEKNPNILD